MRQVRIIVATLAVVTFATELMLRPDFEHVARIVAGDDNLTRVTATPFEMDPIVSTQCVAPSQTNPHRASFGHVYVNDLGRQQLMSGQGHYPAGSVIVKQKFIGNSTRRLALHTVMRKMPQGFDPGNGDREYSVVDATGRTSLIVVTTRSVLAKLSSFAD